MDTGTPPDRDVETGFSRVMSVAVLVGFVATLIAGTTIWLLVTDPVTVANAIEDGDVSPLVRRLVDVLVEALATLLDYL